MNDHEHFDRVLASHERAWSLQAHEHSEAAEKARDEMMRDEERHQNAPEEARHKLRAIHRAKIDHHEKQARSQARRAEHARAGYVLDGPDERRDADYQRDHGELIAAARRTGRLRHSAEDLD